jgi:hypothetical protein
MASLDFLNSQVEVQSGSGQRIVFVAPPDDGLGYETRIWRYGQVATRPGNWHDFFNALVWLTFPRAKAALNAGHAAAVESHAGRGRDRDAMTHFDECGIVVVSSDPGLLTLLSDFRWKAFFWERRADLGQTLRCVVFGHATYESLLRPFRGLTAKALLYEMSPDWFSRPLASQLADIDQRLAGELAAGGHRDARALHPLPLMGLPGITADSESPAYYDDDWQFRPGRRNRSV